MKYKGLYSSSLSSHDISEEVKCTKMTALKCFHFFTYSLLPASD